jgi:hypothetical protein
MKTEKEASTGADRGLRRKKIDDMGLRAGRLGVRGKPREATTVGSRGERGRFFWGGRDDALAKMAAAGLFMQHDARSTINISA